MGSDHLPGPAWDVEGGLSTVFACAAVGGVEEGELVSLAEEAAGEGGWGACRAALLLSTAK